MTVARHRPRPVLPYSGLVRIRFVFLGVGVAVFLTLVALVGALVAGLATSISEATPAVEKDDVFGSVRVYDVLDDGTLDPAPSGLTKTVWDTFVRVATLDIAAAVISEFRVGGAPDSDTLAYVYQDRNPEYWVLAANLATSDDHEQLVATLVHEYAHILTLGTDEVDPADPGCPTLSLDEGCAAPDSLIVAFQAQFWAEYGDAAPGPDNRDSDVALSFYQQHTEDFVSDYASTNAVEDIAESFMTFVLEDEPDGDGTIARKLDFFWQQPDLVAIRERIRTEFADDLGLPQ